MALRERLRLAGSPRLVTRAAGRSTRSIAIPRERLHLALRGRVPDSGHEYGDVTLLSRAYEAADDSPKRPLPQGVQPGSTKIVLVIPSVALRLRVPACGDEWAERASELADRLWRNS